MNRICLKCGDSIPLNVKIDGKEHNLQRRKYCLKCSPFKQHNTKKLHCEIVTIKRKYKELSKEQKIDFNQKTYNYQKSQRWTRKRDLVLEKGGCCSSCGYNKNLASISFHHTDPSNKLFEIDSRSLVARTKEAIKIEIDKCVLLCSNCHMEEHYPQFSDWQNEENFNISIVKSIENIKRVN